MLYGEGHTEGRLRVSIQRTGFQSTGWLTTLLPLPLFLYFTIPSSFTVLTLDQMLHVRPGTNMLVQPIEIACSHHLCAGCLKARLLHLSSLHTIQCMYLHKSFVHKIMYIHSPLLLQLLTKEMIAQLVSAGLRL